MTKRKSTNCPICTRLMKVFSSDNLASGIKSSSQECLHCKKRWVVHGNAIIRECRIKEPKSAIDDEKFAEAVEKGAMFYFTGELCAKGHISEIYTSTRGCAQCKRGINKKAQEERQKRINYFRKQERQKLTNKEKSERIIIYGGTVEIPKPKHELEKFLYG